MKSRAAIGNHPLHPAAVVIPIGAWFSTLVGDLAYVSSGNPFWYQFAFYTMLIGICGALLAAVLGFIDYFGVKMSEAGYRVAKVHMVMNLAITGVYALNLWLRYDGVALASVDPGRWQVAFWLQLVSFAALGLSGWLGGKLAFEHKVGVVEHHDPEATDIGVAEAPLGGRASERTRGLQG